MARGMILSGMARNVLTVGVEMQSRLLDTVRSQRLFPLRRRRRGGDHFRRHNGPSHPADDARGRHAGPANGPPRARPATCIGNGHGDVDPWIRIDGHALFRFATESFAALIRQAIAAAAGRWTRPAGSFRTRPTAAFSRRRPSAAASISARFALNMENVGNTSSASIPLALVDVEERLQPGDKLVLCAVGAGMTTAAIRWSGEAGGVRRLNLAGLASFGPPYNFGKSRAISSAPSSSNSIRKHRTPKASNRGTSSSAAPHAAVKHGDAAQRVGPQRMHDAEPICNRASPRRHGRPQSLRSRPDESVAQKTQCCV